MAEIKKQSTWFPHPVLSIFLVISWLLLNNTVAMGHVVLGGILAILIPWFTSRFWPEKLCLKNPGVFARFALVVAYDILIANVTVARLILSPNDLLKPDFLEIPLDIEHPLGISVLASTISLTPGTVSSDLSQDRKTLLVHALHVEDKEEEIARIKARYEKPLMEVFKPC
jgi:multicomponent K+:H+ antiporter subunit E